MPVFSLANSDRALLKPNTPFAPRGDKFAAMIGRVGTLAVRIHETGSYRYSFLVWNLFLAWVPLIAASSAFALARRGVGAFVVGFLVLWLVFFPNAP